jgi:LacI family transcriptional regulator
LIFGHVATWPASETRNWTMVARSAASSKEKSVFPGTKPSSITGEGDAWLEDRLEGLSVPVIFMTMQARPGVSVVAIDNYAGGCLATQHLMEQGYQHIGHISGPQDWWEAQQRKAGWRDSLLAAGVPESGLHAEEGTWSSTSGERGLDRLLARYPEMDAVFVGNDQMALGALQTACRRGKRIPDELAVVGFDGLSDTAHYWPPLTTVRQDLRDLGCTAVRELVRVVEAMRLGQPVSRPVSISLCPELIVRASSCTARS